MSLQTYPYSENGEIIELVRKSEYDRLKWELEESKELFSQARYQLVGFEAEVSGLRAELDELKAATQAADTTSESEVIEETQAQSLQLIGQNERLITERNNLREQVAKAVSGYIGATEVTRKLLADVKQALAGGVAHARSRLELALSRYTNEFNKLTLCPDKPHIQTNVRLFDLVRYMRAELHEAELITDEEYAFLCSHNPGEPVKTGSPSRMRLEDYDELRADLARWQALAGQLAQPLKSITWRSAVCNSGFRNLTEENSEAAIAALAAYESAKAGSLPDPLAEAVKRMEAVSKMPSVRVFATLNKTLAEAFDDYLARLIQAAKGEQP